MTTAITNAPPVLFAPAPEVAPPAPPPTAPGSNQALLPAAEKPSAAQVTDAMAQLYALLSQQNQQSMKQGQAQVQANRAQRHDFEQKRDDAIRREREAQNDKGHGIMDWATKDMGIGSIIGLATFNYPLVMADVAVHKLGLVDNLHIDALDLACVYAMQWSHPELLAADLVARHPEILPGELHDQIAHVASFGQSLDAGPTLTDKDVQPYAKVALAANLAIAALAVTVCTAGTGSAAGVAAITLAVAALACSGAAYTVENVKPVREKVNEMCGTQKAAGNIALGLTIASAVCGVASGGVGAAGGGAAGASASARILNATTSGVQGATQIAQGVDTINDARHERDADYACADATAARHQMERMQRAVEMVIEGLKDLHESSRKSLETLQGAIQTRDQIPVQITSNMRA
jgi:hypothetical protein